MGWEGRAMGVQYSQEVQSILGIMHRELVARALTREHYQMKD